MHVTTINGNWEPGFERLWAGQYWRTWKWYYSVLQYNIKKERIWLKSEDILSILPHRHTIDSTKRQNRKQPLLHFERGAKSNQ